MYVRTYVSINSFVARPLVRDIVVKRSSDTAVCCSTLHQHISRVATSLVSPGGYKFQPAADDPCSLMTVQVQVPLHLAHISQRGGSERHFPAWEHCWGRHLCCQRPHPKPVSVCSPPPAPIRSRAPCTRTMGVQFSPASASRLDLAWCPG
jgi:hypothetical protein